jgi:phosphoenolpyruvate synthase/pyruvate phosphate dikinase
VAKRVARDARASRKIFPEFAEWLVTQGIDLLSPNPDTAIMAALRVAAADHRSDTLAAA